MGAAMQGIAALVFRGREESIPFQEPLAGGRRMYTHEMAGIFVSVCGVGVR